MAQATVTVHVLGLQGSSGCGPAPTGVLMRRSQRNYLEAHGTHMDCVTYQTEYRWRCTAPPAAGAGLGARPVWPCPGVDMSAPAGGAAARAAPWATTALCSCGVSFGDTPLARSIQANVTVAPRTSSAHRGGRLLPCVVRLQDLVLDGSKSYDPNLRMATRRPQPSMGLGRDAGQPRGHAPCSALLGPVLTQPSRPGPECQGVLDRGPGVGPCCRRARVALGVSPHPAPIRAAERDRRVCGQLTSSRSSVVTIPRERSARRCGVHLQPDRGKAGRKEEVNSQTQYAGSSL